MAGITKEEFWDWDLGIWKMRDPQVMWNGEWYYITLRKGVYKRNSDNKESGPQGKRAEAIRDGYSGKPIYLGTIH